MLLVHTHTKFAQCYQNINKTTRLRVNDIKKHTIFEFYIFTSKLVLLGLTARRLHSIYIHCILVRKPLISNTSSLDGPVNPQPLQRGGRL